MSLVPSADARSPAISSIARLALTTAVTARTTGQGQGLAGRDALGLMGSGPGSSMGNEDSGTGGFGGIGSLVLALLVIAIAILAFRRRQP